MLNFLCLCFCISIKRRLERSCLTILIYIQHQFLGALDF